VAALIRHTYHHEFFSSPLSCVGVLCIVEPCHLLLNNGWQKETVVAGEAGSNILGGNVLFVCDSSLIKIPEYSHTLSLASAMAWYGAHLVAVGTSMIFDTPKPVPVWTMEVGERYVEDYLLQEGRGGGFYMEHHDCPHLHVPMNAKATGFLIMGKFLRAGAKIAFTAFKIPYGFGVYMPPGVIHCDAFLKGKYMVAYTNANNFSTALFRTGSMDVVKVHISNPSTGTSWELDECWQTNINTSMKFWESLPDKPKIDLKKKFLEMCKKSPSE